jgi:hypothetical protein
MMMRWASIGVFAAAFALAIPARAEVTAEQCDDALSAAPKSRSSGKLVEALRLYQLCAQDACTLTSRFCREKLSEINDVPSVVISVKDSTGADVIAATASIDGGAALRIDGREIPIDPGPHVITVVAGARTQRTEVLVAVGQKNRAIQVTFDPVAPATPVVAAPPPPSTSAAPPTEGPATQTPSSGGDGEDEHTSGDGLRTGGWLAFGAGAVGLVVGTIAGLVAIGKESAARCDGDNVCGEPQSRKDAQGAASISTVAFVAGAVLTSAVIVMLVLAPKHAPTTPTSARLELGARASAGGGGLTLRGWW